MTNACYIGIDVSKAMLDVGTSTRLLKRFANTPEGHLLLVEYLKAFDPVVAGIESTGIYSRDCAAVLAKHGFRVAVTQPCRVRHFGRSQGILAKTDKIDCTLIALYCQHTANLRLYQPPGPAHQAYRALVDRRDQLVEDRKREANRLEGCSDKAMQRDIRQNIARLVRRIARFDAKIAETIRSDETMSRKNECLQATKGVGDQTAACLMAHLPELGTVNRQQIAALAGLAPYNNDSGTKTGTRSIYGGRARVRTALYMAALTAVRWDATLKGIYRSLLLRGKKKKVALTACARKLLVRLNTEMARLRLAETEGNGDMAPCA